MRLPISIEQDLLRYGTSVIFCSAATLDFASRKSLNRNYLVGKCIRSPKSEFIRFMDNKILNAFFLPKDISWSQILCVATSKMR